MGKLSDLWKELGSAKPDDIPRIQTEINRIEQYCIDNNYAGIKEKTDWSKKQTKKTYRFEGERMKGYNPPETARYGKDRCGACIYNRHPYCDPEDKDGHYANI